jgi:hypothetical protein
MIGFKKHSKEIKKSSFPYTIISTGDEKTEGIDTRVVNTMNADIKTEVKVTDTDETAVSTVKIVNHETNADKIEIREQASDEIKVLLATIIAYNLKLSNSKVISADEILKSAYPKLAGA